MSATLGLAPDNFVAPDYLSDDPTFNCSGFVSYLLRHSYLEQGLPVPTGTRYTNQYFDNFGVQIDHRVAGAGDLVFFSYNGLFPSHMGILVSADEYVHAAKKHNYTVRRETLDCRPIEAGKLYRTNPIGFKRLAVRVGRYAIV